MSYLPARRCHRPPSDLTPPAYLVNLRCRGVKLYPHGKELRVIAPPDTLTLTDRVRIRQWQKELCLLLREEMRHGAAPLPWNWMEAERLLRSAALAYRRSRTVRRCQPTMEKALVDVVAAYQAHDMARLHTACAVLRCFAVAAQPG